MKKFNMASQLCKLLFLFSPTMVLFAGNHRLPVGSRQAGMGRISVTLTDFWSCQNNQAGIALIDKKCVGIYYESRYLLPQLSTKSVGVILPTRIGVLGGTFSHFGYELYSDIKIGLIYARSFSPYFRIGVQLDYLQTSLGDNYGRRANLTFELGIQSDISPSLTVAVWLFNPLQVNLASHNSENVPAIFRLGLKWEVSTGLLICLEAEKNTSIMPVTLRAGIEYSIKDRFFIRLGASSREELFAMGFGFQLRLIRFDISATMHESLGFSPQSSLVLQF